jgi:hypothetical protein
MKDEKLTFRDLNDLIHPSSFRLHPCLWLCSSNGTEQASHKREVGGSTPPTATSFKSEVLSQESGVIRRWTRNSRLQTHDLKWAGDVTESIEVLQTSCEGLTPSQSTKLRRSSIG